MFDSFIDLLATIPGLDVIAAIKSEGYRDLSLIVLGALVALLFIRISGFFQTLYWRRRAEDSDAKLEEARSALNLQANETRIAQKGKIETESALAAQSRESHALKAALEHLRRQMDEQIPQGAMLVSAETVHRLLDGRLWSRPVASELADLVAQRSRIPILAVGNLKGGVGKTTCAANLGATFAQRDGLSKRTLFIDLDFQSSLSGILNAVSSAHSEDRVSSLMDAGRPVASRLVEAKRLSHERLTAGCEYYDCTMNVTLLEDRLTLSWLLHDLEASLGDAEPVGSDLRLLLKAFLLSGPVQERYDLVVIDLPPRNSALAYNALCAATDLLLVTRPDLMSSDSIGRFISYLEPNRPRLFPNLRIAGVAVNAVTGQDRGWRERVLPIIQEALSEWGGRAGRRGPLPTISSTKRIYEVADRGFAIFNHAAVRSEFEVLAAALHLFSNDDVEG